MADDGGNYGAGNDVVELEAMRKDSYSWHPCQVSLWSVPFPLTVLPFFLLLFLSYSIFTADGFCPF